MLYGVTSIVFSFSTSLFYVIPGLVSIFIGKLLVDVGLAAKKAFQSDDDTLGIVQPVIHTYGRFLFVFGIVIVGTIASYLAFFLFIYIVY